jgi:hypothetical protein
MATVQFQVKLENVDLSKTEVKQLEKDINALVAKQVVRAVPKATPLGTKLKINPEWLGIWLKRFKSVEAIKNNAGFKQVR